MIITCLFLIFEVSVFLPNKSSKKILQLHEFDLSVKSPLICQKFLVWNSDRQKKWNMGCGER
jgi:hypothetical protein